MDGRDSIQSLLVLRKLTRAIADAVRAQMTEYLTTLAPLLRPQMVLGDYVQGGAKESTRKADKAFKELQALYETVAATKPFNLPRELPTPINFSAAPASRSRRSTIRMSCSRARNRARSWCGRR